MKAVAIKFGQLIIILVLIGFIIYSNYSNKDKIDADVLYSNVFVDEYLEKSTRTIDEITDVLYDRIMKQAGLEDGVMKDLESMHSLTDSVCEQITALKYVAVEIAGGMQEKGNFYTINDLGYNFGHKNKLTGDKGKNNGEGSKLKLNIEKLRELELKLTRNKKDKEFIESFLNTSDSQENNSDYMFSWEEQYFKLLPTVGVLNMLSIAENNVLNAERVVLAGLVRNE